MKPAKKKTNTNEALKLFGNKLQANNPKPLRRWVDEKTQDLKAPDAVVVNNLLELKEIIKSLQPDNKSNDPDALPIIVKSKGTRFADEKFAGSITIPQSGGHSMARRTLLEGFEMLKRRQETLSSLQTNEDYYDGFVPAPLADPNEHVTWVDRFIINRLGGRREGLYIVWEIPEGKYRLDPWSCILEKIDD